MTSAATPANEAEGADSEPIEHTDAERVCHVGQADVSRRLPGNGGRNRDRRACTAGGLACRKVWDIDAFDSCVAAANDRYLSGKTDNDTWGDEIRFCCERSGPGSVRAPVPSSSTPLTAVSTGLLGG